VKSSRHHASKKAFVFPLHAISLEKFDIGGVLYHANYFHLLEQAREALLAHAGMPYPQLVAQQQHLAIVHSEQDFIRPIRYGEPIDIAVWCSELKQSTATLKYLLIRDEDSETVHLASTKLVFVELAEKKGFRPQKIPPVLRQAFSDILDPL
jgi:YbgC/YbaW family acyl-CoA thioester hydrolase